MISLLPLTGRLGLDVVCLLVMAGVLYRRRLSAPEMPLVFTSLNLGLFAAVALIGGHDIPTGVGFGLFGLLSLVRLRSAAFTLKDVAYTFIALVLGLANGLLAAPLPLVVGIDIVLVVALAIADESRSSGATRVMQLTLDHAMLDPDVIRSKAAHQLPGRLVALKINDVDHVRDLTHVSARYEIDVDTADAWPSNTLEDAHDDD